MLIYEMHGICILFSFEIVWDADKFVSWFLIT